MTVGYCSACRQLVKIVEGGRHNGYLGNTTSRRWYPLAHRRPDGEWCGSAREAGNVDFGIKHLPSRTKS